MRDLFDSPPSKLKYVQCSHPIPNRHSTKQQLVLIDSQLANFLSEWRSWQTELNNRKQSNVIFIFDTFVFNWKTDLRYDCYQMIQKLSVLHNLGGIWNNWISLLILYSNWKYILVFGTTTSQTKHVTFTPGCLHYTEPVLMDS